MADKPGIILHPNDDPAPRRRSFAEIADDLATWSETIEMLELQITQAPLGDERDIMIDERAELQAGVDRLAAELAQKADAVTAVLKRFKAEAQLIADEEMRLTARRLRLEKTREWLQQYVIATLDRLGTPFIKTPTATIRVQSNGGVAPLKTDAEQLDPVWTDVNLRMPYALFHIVRSLLTPSQLQYIRELSGEPSNSRIRSALAERCEECAGAGVYCQDQLCEACNGTGTRQIHGAKLEPRGRHLRCS